MSVFSKIRDYQKTYGFFKAIPIILKRKKDNKAAKEDMAKLVPFIDKEYSQLIEKYKNVKVMDSIPKRIFFFWYDGINNMPDIPRMCYKQIQKLYSNDYEIIFIDKNNYKNYVTINPDFEVKFNKNEIKIQHFADVLRFYLMNQLGGIWVDSTVYLPSKIDFCPINMDGYYTLITKSTKNFFSYKNNFTCWNSFLFGLSKNHPISNAMIDLFTKYLLTNNQAPIYFLMDSFLTLLQINNISCDIMNRFAVKNELNYDPFYLSNNLSSIGDNSRLAKATNGPQKLNWRISINKFKSTSLIQKIYNEVSENEN